MLRLIKRRRVIKKFVWHLPLELQARFGEKSNYSIEQIDRAVDGQKRDKAFIAYAHALFCSRKDFDDHYSPLKVKCTYDDLREFVAKRFFRGARDFNASSLLRFAKQSTEWDPNPDGGHADWGGYAD